MVCQILKVQGLTIDTSTRDSHEPIDCNTRSLLPPEQRQDSKIYYLHYN